MRPVDTRRPAWTRKHRRTACCVGALLLTLAAWIAFGEFALAASLALFGLAFLAVGIFEKVEDGR